MIKSYFAFFILAFFLTWGYAEAQQATGSVNIANFVPIQQGGTLSFTTPQQIIMNFTLPDGVSGELLVATTEVQNATTNGFAINFLSETLIMKINPPDACVAGCKITFTFDDTHLSSAGISDPSQVVIYQDSNEDGTFVPLPTILIDDMPSPYIVFATITSTSFFGIGVLEDETFCGKTLQQWDDLGVNIIIGTEKKDTLRGTNGADLILGLGGNDRILGKDGDDCLIGGDGDDLIVGEKGNDIIFGNEGNDRLYGGKGDDIMDGGLGSDRLTGNSDNDVLSGGSGNDRVEGKSGNDALFGSSGNDDLKGGSGDDLLDGGDDLDKCNGGSGKNKIIHCEKGNTSKDDDDSDDDEK
jgi:hypothetical protein